MKRTLDCTIRLGLCALLAALAAGCSSKEGPQWSPQKKVRSFRMATRQLPPEPVYNPVTWVRPPQIAPTRKYEASRAPLVLPVMEFSIDNAPLSEAVLVLAAPTRYATYCSSTVADQRLSLTMVGTMPEIAQEIEAKTGVRVIIDHTNREVRFLGSGGPVRPQFE